jgi:LysM repeat protein
MLKTLTLPVLLLIVALLVPATLSGQVSYQVSDQKVVLDGQTYYMHLVLKDQTLYSIAKTYNVSIDAITSNNVIPDNGIQTDQVLRIPESAAMAATMKKSKPPTKAVEDKEPNAKAQPAKETPPPASVSSTREDKPAPPAAKAESEGYRMHKVRKGETLYSLSRDYRVTVEAIIRVNDVPRNEIQIGQMLKIPPSDYVTFVKEETPARVTPTEEVAKDAEKEVKTSTAETKATVPQQEQPPAQTQTQTQTQPQAGSPEPEKQKAKPEPKTYHKVKKGESLSDIAQKYNVTVREIKDANEGLIFPMTGMKLVIPVKNSEGAGTEIKK